jgi:predicted enzyme related to lactoylglutathione lyase
MDVGPMGRMAISQDPQGHPFGLWQAGQQPGMRIYNEPGSLVWNEAAVEDPAAARDFYGSVFDFRFDELEGAGGYTTFATGEAPLGGLSGHQPGSSTGWTCCFAVHSTDEAVATAEKGGAKVVLAAQDSPYGRFAVLADPWAAVFSVMQVAPADSGPTS